MREERMSEEKRVAKERGVSDCFAVLFQPPLQQLPLPRIRQPEKNNVNTQEQMVRLTPWALSPFLVGVLSAAAAIRKLPHTMQKRNGLKKRGA